MVVARKGQKTQITKDSESGPQRANGSQFGVLCNNTIMESIDTENKASSLKGLPKILPQIWLPTHMGKGKESDLFRGNLKTLNHSNLIKKLLSNRNYLILTFKNNPIHLFLPHAIFMYESHAS